jgi:hypothetical protein
MPTQANVWEIDGREMAPPSELGSGVMDVGEGVKEGISVGGNNGGYQAYRPPVVQGQGEVVRPPSVENGNSNWSKRNAEGEFLGSRPVGQAL